MPGTLDAARFTIDPSVTFKIIGTATIPTPLGNVSGALTGNLALAAPTTLRVPGSPQWRFGVQVSVDASYDVPGASGTATILPLQCIGDCSATTRAGRAALGTLPGLTPGGTGIARSIRDQGQGTGGPFALAGAPLLAQVPSGARSARPRPPVDPQPAIALAPDGLAATLWLAASRDGSRALRARIGDGRITTLATNSIMLETPQVAWLGPHRALAVWVASTADPRSGDQVRSASADARPALLQSLLRHQRLFAARCRGPQVIASHIRSLQDAA